MTPVLDLEIHELPSLYNVFMRKHWSAKKKETDYWNQLVWKCIRGYRQNAYNLFIGDWTPLEHYKLQLIRYSSKEPDYDGLVGSFKLVVDGLRYSNVIADDKLSNSGPWDVSWVKCKPKEGLIEVRVYER